jgi:hypothetical protein
VSTFTPFLARISADGYPGKGKNDLNHNKAKKQSAQKGTKAISIKIKHSSWLRSPTISFLFCCSDNDDATIIEPDSSTQRASAGITVDITSRDGDDDSSRKWKRKRNL